jgi:thiamine phosphate synthase YjbQ (UPF0047 family)
LSGLSLKIVRVFIESPGYTVIDLTESVRGVVVELKMDRGIVVVYTNERGCSVTEIEYEPNLLADLEDLLKKLGCIETALCDVVLSRSIVIPVINGNLFLGQFKKVVLVDTSKKSGEKSLVMVLEGVFKGN